MLKPKRRYIQQRRKAATHALFYKKLTKDALENFSNLLAIQGED